MEILSCTFNDSKVNCPNCGEALTAADYYTATFCSKYVKPRRKSQGYMIEWYENVGLNHGSLCVKCGRFKCVQSIKRLKKPITKLAIISVVLLLSIFLISIFSSKPLSNISTILILIPSILLFIFLFACAVCVLGVIMNIVALYKLKDVAKLTKKSRSSLYAHLNSLGDKGHAQAGVYPIAKYKYLQKKHKVR
jgi:amino acid transporter